MLTKMGVKGAICVTFLFCLATTSDAVDNCSGRCGTFDLNNFDCQCNAQCTSYGNCCPDYSTLCAQGTCVGRNCYGNDPSLPCQCNSVCANYNDCCSDYEEICIGSCEGRCGPGTDSSQNCQCNSSCMQYGDCCSDYAAQCTGTGTSAPGTGTSEPNGGGGGTTCTKLSVSNSELLAASYNIWSADVNSASPGDIVTNPQPNASGDAPENFFTFVNEEILEGDMFQKLLALQDNYIRTQGNSEFVTDTELQENSAFLDAVLDTEVGQELFAFLDSKNLAGCDGLDGFKTILNDIWFGMYNRQATHDTSGFEHSFVGEIKGSGVSGFHNWVHFYNEEKAGNFNYQEFLSSIEASSNITGVKHTWYGATKPINGFTIGTSPEIELAMFTLCHLSRPNSQCTVQIKDQDGNPMTTKIQTYTWSNSYPPGGQSYVASAYFIS